MGELYSTVLERSSVTEGEIKYYLDRLSSGDSRAAVASDFVRSDEATTKRLAQINQQVQSDRQQAQGVMNDVQQKYLDCERARMAFLAASDTYYQRVNERADASTVLSEASRLDATMAQLAAAHQSVIAADGAFIGYASASAPYNAALARIKVLTDLGVKEDLNIVTLTAAAAADHAAAAGAAARASLAMAAVKMAAAYQAEQAIQPAARQVLQITQLYLTLANRAPSMFDVAFWATKLNGGATLADLAGALIPAGMANDAFIAMLYTNGLGRPADASGLQFWGHLIAGNTVAEQAQLALAWIDGVARNGNGDTILQANRVTAALNIVKGDVTSLGALDLSDWIVNAHRDASALAAAYDPAAVAAGDAPLARTVKLIARLYAAFMNRAPDASGMLFWADAATRIGMSEQQLADALLGSAEAQQRLPASLASSEFVDRLFGTLAGRAATAAELAAYSAQLASGSRGAVAVAILNQLTGAAGPDLLALTTRTLLEARTYTSLSNLAPAMAESVGITAAALRFARAVAASDLSDLDVVVKAKVASVKAATLAAPPPAPNLLTLDRWGNTLSTADLRNPNWITEYCYDASNRVTMVMKPSADDSFSGSRARAVSEYAYDALGRLATSKDARGNVTGYLYDGAGNVRLEVHPDGGVVSNEYNVFGERTAVTQGNGVRTTYAYDRLGRLSSVASAAVDVYAVTDLNGAASAVLSGHRALVERYAYDELGNRKASWKEGDAAGTRLEQTLMSYDLAGNLIKVQDANGAATLYRYDSFHHRIATRDANQIGTELALDSYGRVASRTDLGGATISYRYNGAGQVVAQTSTARGGLGAEHGQQNIVSSYDNGLLTRVEDKSAGTVATYAYDQAGNRVLERMTVQDSTGASSVVQNNHIMYDELGRMVRATDDHFAVTLKYDLNGNRTLVNSDYVDSQGARQTIASYNVYDAMNRATISNGDRIADTVVADGDRIAGTVVAGAHGHAISYDLAGNRLTDTYRFGDPIYNQTTIESFSYDAAGRLTMLSRRNTDWSTAITLDQRWYDAAGRLARSGTVGPDDTLYTIRLSNYGVADAYQVYAYDAAGQLRHQTARNAQDGLLEDTVYAGTADSGRDNVGNERKYTVRTSTGTTVYSNDYARFDSYKRLAVSSTIGSAAGTTITGYDANGNIVSVLDTASPSTVTNYVTDGAGRVLRQMQNGVAVYTLVVNGRVLGSNQATATPLGLANMYTGGNTGSNVSGPSVYTVQESGETLQGIARSIWGDASLWYLIADANGLDGNVVLTQGTLLKVPTRVNTVTGGYDAFQPYNPVDTLGRSVPTMPVPATSSASCGTLGNIATIAISAMTTYMTAGAASTLGNLLYANGAMGSASGSPYAGAMVRQASTSWSAAARTTVNGNVIEGDGGADPADLAGTSWAEVARRIMLSNSLSQGSGTLAGAPQNSFNWNAVAAAGAPAAGQTMSPIAATAKNIFDLAANPETANTPGMQEWKGMSFEDIFAKLDSYRIEGTRRFVHGFDEFPGLDVITGRNGDRIAMGSGAPMSSSSGSNTFSDSIDRGPDWIQSWKAKNADATPSEWGVGTAQHNQFMDNLNSNLRTQFEGTPFPNNVDFLINSLPNVVSELDEFGMSPQDRAESIADQVKNSSILSRMLEDSTGRIVQRNNRNLNRDALALATVLNQPLEISIDRGWDKNNPLGLKGYGVPRTAADLAATMQRDFLDGNVRFDPPQTARERSESAALRAQAYGPSWSARDPVAEANQRYEDTNRMTTAMLVVFGLPALPGAISRMMGQDESQVYAANQVGGAMLELGLTLSGVPSRGPINVVGSTEAAVGANSIEAAASPFVTSPTRAAVRELKDFGLNNAQRRSFFEGKQVLFEDPSTAFETATIFKLSPDTLHAGVYDMISDGSGAVLSFANRSRSLGNSLGVKNLELFGADSQNPQLQSLMIRRGFEPGPPVRIDAFGFDKYVETLRKTEVLRK